MSRGSLFLSLIECTDGSIATGITVDVETRVAAHQNGKDARYMRSVRLPDRWASKRTSTARRRRKPSGGSSN